ncbi:MAG TPA: PAS domain S-box protein [Stenomitos sp.]
MGESSEHIRSQPASEDELAALRGELQRLRRKAERSDLLDLIQDTVIERDLAGRISFWNRGAERTYGWTAAEAIGRSSHDLLGTRFPYPLNEIEARLARDGSWEGELVQRRKGGSTLTVASRWVLRRDEHGQPVAVVETHNDISGQKQAEIRFQTVFESAPIGMALVAPDRRLLMVNQAMCDLFGYTKQELMGMTFQRITHPDDLAANVTLFERLKTGQASTYQMEKRYLHKDGHVVWASLSSVMVRDEAGRPLYAISQIQDIGARKHAEQAIRDREQRLRILFESIVDYAIIMLDPEGRVAAWNPGAERIKGYSAEEILGQSFEVFYTDEDRRRGLPRYLLDQAIELGHVESEGWHVRKGGTCFWADEVVTALRGDQGRLIGFVKVVRDLTERKRSEEERGRYMAEIERQRDFTQRIIDHAPVIIAYVDRDLKYRMINPALERAMQRSAQELLGHSLLEIYGPETWERLAPLLKRVIETGQPLSATSVPLVGPERTTFWDRTFQPVVDRQGGVEGVLLLAIDVSERVEKNRLQQERIAILEQTDRMKDEFLSVISHELRTPLNFITGFTCILDDELQGPLNADQHASIGKVLEGADRMLSLVNNLLDMSRLVAGKFQLVPSCTPYPPIVDEVVSSLAPLAEQKRIVLEAAVDVSGEVDLDGQRIIQVLSNLVDNAIKFTPEGGKVRIHAFERNGEIVTEVTDTGPGIASDDQAKLFHLFSQVDMSPTRQAGGTGLGLAISKAIVQGHGGQMGVRSQPGHGSTFWFTLPRTFSGGPADLQGDESPP